MNSNGDVFLGLMLIAMACWHLDELKRRISHPDWLPEALRHAESVARLYQTNALPEILLHEMVSGAAYRVLRACYPGRWTLVWVMFIKAMRSERERMHGILFRFWRYRIQMKSPEVDLNELMAECDEADFR